MTIPINGGVSIDKAPTTLPDAVDTVTCPNTICGVSVPENGSDARLIFFQLANSGPLSERFP